MTKRLIWFLPLGGLLYVAGVLLRGEFANPLDGDAALFAERAGRAGFSIAYLLIMCASGFMMVGYVALRDQLSDRLGPAAAALAIVGLNFLTAFFGVMAIAYPTFAAAHLQGDAGAVQIAAQAIGGPITMAVMALVTINLAGLILFAIAMWRTRWVPRAAIVAFVAAPVMQLIPWIYPIEILGCVLAAVSGALIAIAATGRDRLPQAQAVA